MSASLKPAEPISVEVFLTWEPGDGRQYELVVDPVRLIEILAPSNRAETWSNVWTCTTIPSVQEILVLRSDAVAAPVLRRDAGGMWPETPETPETIASGDLTLASIGFRAPIGEMYAGTDLVT